jgi:hypothetical protein
VLLILECSFSLQSPAFSEWSKQVRSLIAHKQLHPAEEMIVSRMMKWPRDPELITLLAEVRLDQRRFPEAFGLCKLL